MNFVGSRPEGRPDGTAVSLKRRMVSETLTLRGNGVYRKGKIQCLTATSRSGSETVWVVDKISIL